MTKHMIIFESLLTSSVVNVDIDWSTYIGVGFFISENLLEVIPGNACLNYLF